MANILVTLLSPTATEKDVEIPNDIVTHLLLKYLLVQLEEADIGEIEKYDLEFSLNKADWQKVEKYYCLYEVGVWDGVFIRVVKNSTALSAPRLSFVLEESGNSFPAGSQTKTGEHAIQKTLKEKEWKVIG